MEGPNVFGFKVETTTDVSFAEIGGLVIGGNATKEVAFWTTDELVIIILYCCSSIVGTAANVFVIVAVANLSQRSRNDFILSLCISDLLVCTVSMPLSLTTILIRAWKMGVVFCKVSFYFQSLPVAASTTSLMVLALDRYAIVKHPRISTKFRPQLMILIVWSGAAFITCPILYARDIYLQQCKEIWPTDQLKTMYTLSHMAVIYVIPCLTVASCHLLVGHKLCAASHSSLSLPISLPLSIIKQPQHVIIVSSVTPDSPSRIIPIKVNEKDLYSDKGKSRSKPKSKKKNENNLNKTKIFHDSINCNQRFKKTPPLVKQFSRQSLHSRRRLANMLVIMVIVFAICWAPYVCLKIYLELGIEASVTPLPYFLLLGHSHSAINPLVYYLSNRQSLSTSSTCQFQWPWEKKNESKTLQNYTPPSSTNEAALGIFHPSYTTKRYQPKQGCTNDFL